MCSTGNFFQNMCSTGNKIQKHVSGVGLMHFGPIERILSPKNAFPKCCFMAVVEISTEIDIFAIIERKWAYNMGHNRCSGVQLGPLGVFPRHITSPGVDLRSVHLQTSEGENCDFLAPPETFWHKKCSTGNFFRKRISGVDLMHFGPIERILRPKIDFGRYPGCLVWPE